jgi:glycosyltransferase involved in cell wall biosynthesis
LEEHPRRKMLNNKRIVVVMPAYNAARTLERCVNELPQVYIDHVILVDDASSDHTHAIAENLGVEVFRHPKNLGYGANQKTCYRKALEQKADIVVMFHPDYQYPPSCVLAMAALLAYDAFDFVMGSRILCGNALKGGMPLYKYIFNRLLTFIQNVVLGLKLSEYHTGFRAYTKKVLEEIPVNKLSNDFVFDNQFVAYAAGYGFRIGEVSTPAVYRAESSSINFRRSIRYGVGVLATCLQYVFGKFRRQ